MKQRCGMAEMSFAELQQHHYRAVRENPEYRLVGMLEVEREEVLAMIPGSPDLEAIEDRLNDLEAMVAERGRVPRQYYDQLEQIRGEVVFLRNKVNELSSKRAVMPGISTYKGLSSDDR